MGRPDFRSLHMIKSFSSGGDLLGLASQLYKYLRLKSGRI
jgi:hypothetical protein